MNYNDFAAQFNNIGIDEMVFIQHENNKDVYYWPMSIQDGVDHVILNGWWVIVQTKAPTALEQIKIKLEDLPKWKVLRKESFDE